MSMVNREEVLKFSERVLKTNSRLLTIEAVTGGDINVCYRVRDAIGASVFVKSNEDAELLKSECDALVLMEQAGAKNYPQVLGFELTEQGAMLALEFIHLESLSDQTAIKAGQALANQHAIKAELFGWQLDGFIGFSKQANNWSDSWADFFSTKRLQPQLLRAIENRITPTLADKIARISQNISDRIDCDDVTPTLLHGDLWAGNLGYDSHNRRPVFYDPAPYYGDREADISMTLLFGALPEGFYHRYRAVFPEPADFSNRLSIYNLYHALNHFNMFGRGYQGLLVSLCDRVL